MHLVPTGYKTTNTLLLSKPGFWFSVEISEPSGPFLSMRVAFPSGTRTLPFHRQCHSALPSANHCGLSPLLFPFSSSRSISHFLSLALLLNRQFFSSNFSFFFPRVSLLQHPSEQSFATRFFTARLIIFHLSALSSAALLQPRYSKLILLMYQIKLFLIICLTLNSVPFVKLKPTFRYY